MGIGSSGDIDEKTETPSQEDGAAMARRGKRQWDPVRRHAEL